MADGKIRKKIIEKDIKYSVEPDDMHSVFTVENILIRTCAWFLISTSISISALKNVF